MVAPPRRLLIVTYTFPPYGTVGHVTRLTKFARYLPALGWQPTVLTISDDPKLQFFERNSGFLLEELGDDVEVVRTKVWQPSPTWAKSRRPDSSTEKPAAAAAAGWQLHRQVIRTIRRQLLVPDLALPWIPTAVAEARRLAAARPFDAVLASIPLNSNGVAGALIARSLRVPLVIDVRDDWVDGAYYLEKGTLARAAERRLEQFVFESATRVVVVARLSLERYRARYPEIAERFAYIPNGFDLSDLKRGPAVAPAKRADRILFVHSGMTGPLRSPVPLFRALRAAIDADPSPLPRFEVIFVGELLPEYHQAIRDFGLESVVSSRAYLPTDEYLALLAESDALLAIADRGYSTEIPGKLYAHWAIGRPTLLIADAGAGADLVAEHSLGWTISAEDHEALVAKLRELRALKARGSVPMVERGQIERFDRRRLTAELAELLDGIRVKTRG